MTKSVDDARLNALPEFDSSAEVDSLSGGQFEPEEITALPPGVGAWLTVIVPTRNEAGNVESLLRRLRAGLGDVVAEVLFVDDSTDGTDNVIRNVGRTSGQAVR